MATSPISIHIIHIQLLNVWPLGYVTGSAVPEQSVAETDMVLGLETGEEDPESTKSPQTKGVPKSVAAATGIQ